MNGTVVDQPYPVRCQAIEACRLEPLGDGVFLMLVGLLGGACSLSQCVVLWSDAVLRRVAGWVRIPDEHTLGRLFKA